MTLQNLIQSYTWAELEATMLRLYPTFAESLEAHAAVFNDLKALSPAPSRMRIVLAQREGLDGEQYVDVSGMDGTLKMDSGPEYYATRPEGEQEEAFAIEWTDWREWLSMEIAGEVLAAYSEEEIIVHCLWEMTFCGYSLEEVSEQREELRQRVEEVEREWEVGKNADERKGG